MHDHQVKALVAFRRYRDGRIVVGGVLESDEGPIYFDEEMGPFDDAADLPAIAGRLMFLMRESRSQDVIWRQLALF